MTRPGTRRAEEWPGRRVMTFREFCDTAKATPEERRELWIYLTFVRFRKMILSHEE